MFVEPTVENVIKYLGTLDPETQPVWGKMSAQRMIEHLTDTVQIATGKNPQDQIVPDEKLPGMLRFLASDKEMAKDIQVPFAKEGEALRHSEIELALDELIEELIYFEELYAAQEGLTQIHPYYGPLDYEQWTRLNSKHLTHHFKQFGLL
ncbi:hydroxymethylglutaryl-CoA reductase [Lishizhenia tianjinensis]|jgi:hypothetical protein|uniref:Hydroxymethylglutaryl-CoA reductase n=1 Tax=Lishizhenia tianjinensis TaxID=477690 RepID=A0A1I7AHD2_9FLAO|nr:DUF1569 domain-containing protein [Lishizhenia tianjinensis]SFT74356.1 hydroxymethylglutaryl-CoA reductase [Lishizhenia tianjinensis]